MDHVGASTCLGTERLMAARRLSCSSPGPGPSRAIPSASAAAMYLPTVSFDSPVPEAMGDAGCSPPASAGSLQIFPLSTPPYKPSLHTSLSSAAMVSHQALRVS